MFRRISSLGQERSSSLADYEILLSAHSEKLDQVLKSLGALDTKKPVAGETWEGLRIRIRFKRIRIQA